MFSTRDKRLSATLARVTSQSAQRRAHARSTHALTPQRPRGVDRCHAAPITDAMLAEPNMRRYAYRLSALRSADAKRHESS